MSEKEKALSGLEFVRGDADLKRARDRAEALCFELNQTPPSQIDRRSSLLKELLPHAGDGFFIKPPFLCEYGEYIATGNNFFANYNCKLMDGGRITFGENVLTGQKYRLRFHSICKIRPVTDDMALVHPKMQKGN